MVNRYVVEYKFSNCFATMRKRQSFPGNLAGLSDARKKFQRGIRYIKWSQSEDYESVSLYADTSTDGLVLYKSWDTEMGFCYGNVMEAYADG